MLTMCWSWFFISITLLLVQPSHALHNYQDIRNVIRSRELANTKNLWLRALRSLAGNKGLSPGTIVAIVLALLASMLAATGAFIWYARRTKYGSVHMPVGWWSQVRHRRPPMDIEKGLVNFQSRFAAFRSEGREKVGLPPQVIVEEPPAPILPHKPRYPSVLERLSNSRATMLFSNARKPQSSRVLVPALVKHSSNTSRRQGRVTTSSPTDYMKSLFRRSQNPFVPAPHETPTDSQSRSSQDSDISISSIPLISPLDCSQVQDETRQSPGSVAKSRKRNPVLAERVRLLHMDLSKDFRGLDALMTLPTPMRVVHLGDESMAKLRKAKSAKSPKTTKSLRFLLPTSPKNLLAAPPHRLVAAPAGGNGKSNLKPLISASSGRKLPKTAYI